MRSIAIASIGSLLLLTLMTGCGGGSAPTSDFGSSTTSTGASTVASTDAGRSPSSAGALAVAGSAQGAVGESFLRLARTTTYSARTDQAVLVGEGPLPATLPAVYAAGQPIVLVEPDLARVDELRARLGMSPYSFPAGVTRLDFYGLSNAGGADAELVGFKPAPDPTATGEEGSADDSHPLAPEVIHVDETQASVDDDVQRALDFIAGHRDVVAVQGKTAQASASPTPSAPTPGLDFQLAKVRRVERDYTFEFQKAKMNVTTTVWAVHHVDTGDDYFFVRQSGTFAPSLAMERNRADDRGWYVNNYLLKTIVDGYEGSSTVSLATGTAEPQPRTAEGVTEVTSSFGFSLGGKFTYSDSADKGSSRGVELNGQLNLSESRKISIPDMKIQSLCGSQINDASWRYVMNVPDGLTWVCRFPNFGEVPYLPDISHNTFYPVNFWAWKVKSSMRDSLPNGLPIRVTGTMRLSRLRLPVPCLASHQSVESKPMVATFTVAWPPR